MQPVLLQNIEEVKSVCRQHKVKKLYVFGSVCTDAFNHKSDIVTEETLAFSHFDKERFRHYVYICKKIKQ